MYAYGPLHIDEQKLDDQLEPIYNGSVPIPNIAWKAYGKLWTRETSVERGSVRSELEAWHDDDNDDY